MEGKKIKNKEPNVGGAAEFIRTIIYALLIALMIRTIAYEPFSVPSTSMQPTLTVGDYFFVSKYSYGYSRFSLPFGPPLFSGRIFEKSPKRGDVVVFKVPTDNKTDYVKRIVGLPGDTVQMIDGILHINGDPVTKKLVVSKELNNDEEVSNLYLETLNDGTTYLTKDIGNTFQDTTRVYSINPGYFFMMGDNRDNSRDSRLEAGGFGVVPIENFVGRAEIIFFSANGNARLWEIWKWPWGVRYGRLAESLR